MIKKAFFFAALAAVLAITTPVRVMAQAGVCQTLSFAAGATYGSTCSQTLATTQNDDHLATTAFVNDYFSANFLSSLTGAALAPTGASVARTLGDHLGEMINLGDYAPHDAIGWADATMAVGSNQMCSASATFTAADIGKSITIGQIGPASSQPSSNAGVSMWGTIATVPSSHCVTVTFASQFPPTAQYAVPFWGLGNCKVVNPGINYNAGDLVYVSVGLTPVIPASCEIIDSQVVAASVVSGGSGVTNAYGGADGADGTCTVEGTTGALRENSRPNYVNLTATVVAGSITAVSILNPGDYVVNPNTINSVSGAGSPEPVAPSSSANHPCTGLTGATVSLQTGMLKVTPYNYGYYSSKLSGNGTAVWPVTTNGAGINGTLTTVDAIPGGGQYTYGTDATAGIAKAIDIAEADAKLGMRVGIYAPGGECAAVSGVACYQLAYSGAYYVGGATLPYMTQGEALLGAERNTSLFYMAPSYSGALAGYSQKSVSSAGPFNGQTQSISATHNGPTVANISIVGDLTSPNTQFGIAFYDQAIYADVHDVDVFFVPGQALCLGCANVQGSVGHTRESYFSRLRFFNDGAPTKPTLDVATYNSTGSASGDDDLYFDKVTIYGENGPGVVIHASRGAGMGLIYFDELRVEGTAGIANGSVGDEVQIGDTSVINGVNMDGSVHDVYFTGLQLIDPYTGYWAFHTVGSNAGGITGGDAPYDIYADQVVIGGGSVYGGGVALDWCKNCRVSGSLNASLAVDFQIGPSTQTSSQIVLDFPQPQGTQSYWTNIDPTASYQTPAYVPGNIGQGGGNVALAATLLGASTGTTQAPGVAELVGGLVPAAELPTSPPASTQNNAAAAGTSCTGSPGALTAEYTNVGSSSTGTFLVLSALQRQEVWNSYSSTITVCAPTGAAIANHGGGYAIAVGGHAAFTYVSSTLIMSSP